MTAWNGGNVNDAFVKLPSRDVVDINSNNKTVDEIASLFLDAIGGVELSQLTNYQTVYGTNTQYLLLSDLLNVTADYNPTDWLVKKYNRRGTEEALDYNTYYENVEIIDNGNIEINFTILPNDVDVEVQVDYNAIIDIQETA